MTTAHVVCGALLAMAIALARQVGVLFERVAPMGALITDSGPAVGAAATALRKARYCPPARCA